jgi:hypothetical protein
VTFGGGVSDLSCRVLGQLKHPVFTLFGRISMNAAIVCSIPSEGMAASREVWSDHKRQVRPFALGMIEEETMARPN